MPTRLDTEVWDLDRCCGCGNCVALCSKGVLFWDGGGHPQRETREKVLGLSRTQLDTCTFCQQFCEEGCPRLVQEWHPLEPQRLVAARTRGLVQSGDPRDVIKHVLVAAMASGMIDGAILMDMDPWKVQPVARVVSTVGEVMDSLGSQGLWAPTLSALNEAVFDQHMQNLAVVGTPCVSQAIRRLRESENQRLAPYRQAIRLSIASFCTGVYLPDMVHGLLLSDFGIQPHSLRRLQKRLEDDRLIATEWDGTTWEIPMGQVEKYMWQGCARCDDYLGESADLAVGMVGAQAGYSTLVVQSPMGEACLRQALDLGLLETSDQVDGAALARAKEEKERRQRAQLLDQMMILMLDSLAEPSRRAEVKRAFVRLYETRKPAERRILEEGCYATCAQC